MNRDQPSPESSAQAKANPVNSSSAEHPLTDRGVINHGATTHGDLNHGATVPDRTETSSTISSFFSFFFTRQVFAILLCFLLSMGGLMAYFSMVKEGDPDINIARAQITTTWGGTDAETIENQVTDKIEAEVKSLQGLKEINSATFNSASIITVIFKADAPVAESIQQLRGKVNDAESELPPESDGREPPDVKQLSQQDAPVVTIALAGEGLDIAILSQAADALKDRLEAVKNVREVNLAGQREEVIHVQLLPSRLTTLGISSTQVRDAIQGNNVDTSWDVVRDEKIGTQVRLYGRFRTLEDLRNVPVAGLNDRVIRLAEVAEVYQGLEREENRAFLSWHGDRFIPVINLDVTKVAGSDTIQVVEDTLADLELAKQDPDLWPFGMEYRVLTSDVDLIRNELSNLGSNVLQASLCVFAVLLIALTWREALIAGLAIPLTFGGALFVLWLAGYTLNNMVMVGMILSLGLLVDVFILMLEGMHDAIFTERLPFELAATKTIKTYAAPAFAGQLTTILALVPLIAIAGDMGKFIRPMPISAIVCLSLSYAIALFGVIPLSKLVFGHIQGQQTKTPMDRLTERASAWFFAWSLKVTVPNRTVARLWSVIPLGVFVVAVMVFTTFTVSLFPQNDGRKLSVNVELPPTATLARSQEVGDRIGDFLRTYTDPDGTLVFENIVELVGQRSGLVGSTEIKPSNADYLVGLSAMMVKRQERQQDSFEYVEDMRQRVATEILDDYPGAVFAFQYDRPGGGADPIQVGLYGEDMDVLRTMSAQVQQALREIPGTMDVRDDLGNLRNDYKLVPKREAFDFYNFNQADVGLQGRYLMTDNGIGDFAVGDGQEDMEIRLSTRWPSLAGGIGGPSRLDEFASMRFINDDGVTLPASALLEPIRGTVPLSITHRNTERSVTVLAKNIPGSQYYDSDILTALIPRLEAMQHDPSLTDADNQAQGRWPKGYHYQFGGDADTTGETFGSAGQMMMVALFLVFAVLVLQFGSYSQPVIIMLTIPFALIGTIFGFLLLGLPFSFPAAIGIISLVGIVVNDAIVMVETMNERRKQGYDVRHAAAAGASDRLRPILTTSITTIIGLIPLALSDAKWYPLCMAIIFGLGVATVVALLVVPGLYLQLTHD